jgi:iron complex outermembrane receptor protein
VIHRMKGARARRVRIATCVVGVLAFVSAAPLVPARAQDQPVVLDPTLVEARRIPDGRLETDQQAERELDRTPGGVELVGEDEILDAKTSNLRDALEYVPGVLVRPRFGSEESQISIRGSGIRNNFHVRGVNLLLNGFPYGNADGFADFESLELLSVKRIEVYKGANALRYGANTIGGAINFTTFTGRDAPTFGIRSEFGSFNYFKNSISGAFVSEPFDGYLGLTDTELRGYRAHSQQVRRRAYSNVATTFDDGSSLRLDFIYANVKETLPGSLTRQQFEQNPTQANAEYVKQGAERNYNYFYPAITWRKPIGDAQLIEWLTQFNYQDLDHPLPFAIIDDRTFNYGSEVRWLNDEEFLGQANRLTIGLQYYGTWMADRQYANDQGAREEKIKDDRNEANNVGLYGEEQFLLTDGLTLLLGGRVQWSDRTVRSKLYEPSGLTGAVDDWFLTPRFGLLWQATPAIQVYANANNAVEPPLLLELTAPGNIDGSIKDLKPTDAWQFEIGTRGAAFDDVFLWDLSLYDIELWDEIQNVNVAPYPDAPFTIPRYQNIPRSRHTGVELGTDVTLLQNVAASLGIAGVQDRVRFVNNFTLGDFRFVDNPTYGDNFLPGLPEFFLAGELRYETVAGFWLAPGFEAVPASYDVNSENTASAPGYAFANLKIGYSYAPWNAEIFFEARNLNDVNYVSAVEVDSATGQYFYPGDGRAFYGGLQWRWM